MLVSFAAIAALGSVGFRVNVTPSEPIGLWRIMPQDRPIRNGDLIFICPPETAGMREARARGYLRHGLCLGGIAPLIKTVAATSGQVVEIDNDVQIDGRPLPHSQVVGRDGQGREMVPYKGGVIPPGSVYLHSDFPGSFDSRYFGPLPIENILGLAQEVWAYAP
jgi:conjugative transfer signal peptidase TraF